ncbi:FHA domain-containing protein [Pseudoalteromonas distincta]|uniref:FHA domain-containing protein n=1 Tax=Pseudoalteromonas distincta TaxID=77608 RepID=UPI0039E85916
MAILKHTKLQKNLYLRAFHRFGRLAHSVDTFLDFPEVTRIHAVIEWLNEQWYINDLSKNGVWLNDIKITTNQNTLLKQGDKLSFSQINNLMYHVTSVEPPRDLLFPVNESQEQIIYLEQYHFLPNNKHPEVILHFDSQQHCWYYEDMHEHLQQPINDGQDLRVGNNVWRLFLAGAATQEKTVELKAQPSNNLEFIFNLSLDEELAELKIKSQTTLLDFDVRSHHYLTLLLARYKLQDMQNGFEADTQGWVQVKKLAKDLGISEAHVNIQIHRARKQFVELLNNEIMPSALIERKRGKVRFGGKLFTIYKGKKIESSNLENTIE